MKTNRRDFIGKSGLGLSGIFISSKLMNSKTLGEADYENNLPRLEGGGNPRDVKVNVKLIYYAQVHTTSWEGPCRYSEMIGPDKETIAAKNGFDETVKQLNSSLSQDAKMLEPAYFVFPENSRIERSDLLKLESDKEEVDLYILKGYQLGSHPELYFASVLAEINNKPIMPSAHHGRTTSAYLNSIGAEGYAEYVYGDLNKLISLLRARKAFHRSNMLLITDIGGALKGPGYMRGSVRDFDDLKSRFGIGTTIIRFKELSDERDKIMSSKSSMKEVEDITDNLIRNAKAVHMDKKMFRENVLYYYTVKALMKKHNSNAYSVESGEFCSTRLPEAWKITPCLAFSLLNGEGYPTACEGEIGVLLTMSLFMAISKKSPYSGNLNPFINGTYDPDRYLWVPGADKEKVNFSFGHNVPGLKMLGFDNPDLSYEIRNFIPAKPNIPGWGASLKIDFTKIAEKTITIGRFNPLTTKLLITKGEVIGMRGFDLERCSTEVLINIQDPEGYHLKTAKYGHHFAMVYGDYVKELVHLSEMLKIEIELHNV
jgi:L-fucose isomerase-like protein